MVSIRAASERDVAGVTRLAQACIADMERRGIDQWDDLYPTQETFLADARGGGLYVAGGNRGVIEAAFTLDEHQSPEYREVPWTIRGTRIAVVHRLMIDPRRQGRGLARDVMQQAEQLAAALGYDAMRLDAFTKNPAALRLYRGLGYHDAGSITLRKRLFRCFEKAL